MNKVLVCITIQENSRRLIRKGYDLTCDLEGKLHLLHIRKGDTIFENSGSSELFEQLFIYGSELGGEAHFLCSDNVSNAIAEFITSNKITHLVIGEGPNGTLSPIFEELKRILKHIEIVVLDRKDN
ncbi:MAG: hypothetical protein ACRCW2_04550 [Cellulosilyticaceae bacterium]